MKKIDYKKELKAFYSAKKTPSIIEVPAFNYILADGRGDPNGSKAFQAAVAALFTVSYTIKFMIKKGKLQTDYGVMPLEGQWWAKAPKDFMSGNKAAWNWRIGIMQPELVTGAIYNEGLARAKAKKKTMDFSMLSYKEIKDGKAVQVLHTGPFSEEGPVVTALHDFIKENGCKPAGKHREIYLNNFTKVSPEKMKTIIRQPCEKCCR